MKSNHKLFSAFMALILILSLIPAAFAVKNDNGTTTANTEESDSTKEEVQTEKITDPATELTETISVTAEETYYNDGSTVFNNGGKVYNNAGTVYNNGGIIYNNLGTVYNNGGVVYNNRGTVYANGGSVYNNGGNIIEAGKEGYTRISFKKDVSEYVEMEGPETDEEGILWQPQDDVLTLKAKDGYVISGIKVTDAEVKQDEDGVCTLSGFTDSAVKITVTVCAEAPEISLKTGTYAEKQIAKISATDGMSVYYTIDGTDPTAKNGKLYTSPVPVSEGMILKAVTVSEGVENSEIAAETYGFVTVTGPEFEKVEEGYKAPNAGAITIRNAGETNAVVESVKLEKVSDYFILSTEKGGAVAAGTTDSATWTVQPAEGLAKGKYTAKVIVTLDGGSTVEANIFFTVK